MGGAGTCPTNAGIVIGRARTCSGIDASRAERASICTSSAGTCTERRPTRVRIAPLCMEWTTTSMGYAECRTRSKCSCAEPHTFQDHPRYSLPRWNPIPSRVLGIGVTLGPSHAGVSLRSPGPELPRVADRLSPCVGIHRHINLQKRWQHSQPFSWAW